MRSKKISLILIAIAFLVVVVFSCVFAFSISEVSADFSVTGKFDTEKVQTELDGFKGKNLIFFDLDELKDAVEKDPRLEVVSVKKQFPNVVSVSIKERIEAFRIVLDGETTVLSEEGYVLEKLSADSIEKDGLFLVEAEGISVTGAELSKKIETDNDAVFYTVLEMAKFIDLTDLATGVRINYDKFGVRTVDFLMRTGVKIRLASSGLGEEIGIDMIEKAILRHACRKAAAADSPYDAANEPFSRYLTGDDRTTQEMLAAMEQVTRAQITEAAAQLRLDSGFILRAEREEAEDCEP